MRKLKFYPFLLCTLSALVTFANLANASQTLPTIEDTIVLRDWITVGPFSVGSREGWIDHLLDKGGEAKIQPREGMTHPSTMAPEGVVRWKRVQGDEDWVHLDYEGVNWKALQEPWGWSGLTNEGYAYTEYVSPERRRVLILPDRIRHFYLNGRLYYGDGYGHHYFTVPAILEKGVNRILVKVRGYEETKFSFKLLPALAPLMLNTEDITSPTLIRGQPYQGWIGIPLLNTTERRITDARITLENQPYLKTQKVAVPSLPPLSVLKLALPLETSPDWEGQIVEKDTLWVSITVQTDNQPFESSIPVKIVDPGKAYKVTFLSDIDRSVQYFAVLPPKGYDPAKKYSLILTLHGASVEAYGQVGAYAQKDWAFIVAPTNRRRFGFDWQDWGRLNTLQALRIAKQLLPVDEDRIYLTGHSMGGHGTWHVGLHHPDLFAAMAPSAGWTSFQLYVPFFLQRSEIYAPPELIAFRDRVLLEDRPTLFIENALHLPVFVLQGGDDEEVPPTHARWLVGRLKRLGYEVVYREVQGKGHWWTQEGVEGTACVDYPEMMDFFRARVREPFPKKVILSTTNISLNPRSYWVQIDAQDKIYRLSRVVAEVRDAQHVDLSLSNVRALTLFPTSQLGLEKALILNVNGQRLKVKRNGERPINIHKRRGRYHLGKEKVKGLRKTPVLHGPIKQAFFSPFLFVYGTLGDEPETNVNLHRARVMAQKWWWRANGTVQILADTSVTREQIRRYNLILFGGPASNRITRRINPDLPLSIADDHIELGDRKISGEDLAVQFLYPNPLNNRKFVVVLGGDSPEGEKLAMTLGTFYSGAGLPDFLIYDRAVKEKGWGGIIAAGFFDERWKVSEELLYVNPEYGD